MTKPIVRESRFDFRKGRNSAISPDLLNDDELVDLTNARLTSKYGAVTKRGGCQRMHPNVFPAAIRGAFQWDSPNAKQVVVISGGDLYYRNGYDLNAPFTLVTSTGVARTTANQGAAAGWTGSGNSLSGGIPSDQTVAAGSRIICKLGDPAINNNVDAADDLYTLTFKVTADGTGLSGVYAAIDSIVTVEVSTDGGATYPTTYGPYSATASIGVSTTNTFSPVITVAGAPAQIWIRLQLRLKVQGSGSGTANGSVSVVNGAVNYPATWSTGAARFSSTQPTIFAPFRASTSGAPLVLYMASGGHYFSWDGVSTLTQLDPTNSAPLTTSIISYHTRMFAMSASAKTPGLLPKTIFWSKIGDATVFTTGDKTFGGSAVTDFLTGQQLTALEVIGSSLLMATIDSVMRFQGHASDDIVISQDTEGVSAEVGVVGLQALKRFENAAAFLTVRGPYVATETEAVPIGEQVITDFDALDTSVLANSVVAYNRGRKDLWFIVAGPNDAGLNKTVYAQAVRLQAWQGPWTFSFGIDCANLYMGASGVESLMTGGSDGFLRLMDVGSLDDVLSDGTGGTAITMTIELPTLQFGRPGITKALIGMFLQATLPSGSDLRIQHGFDSDSLIEEAVSSVGTTELNYRVDMDNQGKRLRLLFIDASSTAPILNGFILDAYDYARP